MSSQDKSPHAPVSCPVCGMPLAQAGQESAPCSCQDILIRAVRERPELVQEIWRQYREEAVLQHVLPGQVSSEVDLPDVLDGKRYRAIDRDRNKWYLSVSEVAGRPVEIFASTAFDRDHELQSRISNLTTITRLISLILRHIFLGELLTFDKCLKQIQRSSRQKNDLPDMLYGVLSRYNRAGILPPEDTP